MLTTPARCSALSTAPVLLWRNGHVSSLEGAWHEEFALRRQLTARGSLQAAAFHDFSGHLAVFGFDPGPGALKAAEVLTPGGRVEVTTSLPLSGRIVDSAGLPYQLNAWRSDGRVSGSAPLVAWEHVAPGSYQLLVGPAGAEVPFPFTVAEGQTTLVQVK